VQPVSLYLHSCNAIFPKTSAPHLEDEDKVALKTVFVWLITGCSLSGLLFSSLIIHLYLPYMLYRSNLNKPNYTELIFFWIYSEHTNRPTQNCQMFCAKH